MPDGVRGLANAELVRVLVSLPCLLISPRIAKSMFHAAALALPRSRWALELQDNEPTAAMDLSDAASSLSDAGPSDAAALASADAYWGALLGKEERRIAQAQNADAVRVNAGDSGFHEPEGLISFVGENADTPVSATAPDGTSEAAARNRARCPLNATEAHTYGVVDVHGDASGSLVLMQSVAPFGTRSDLSLDRDVACPHMREQVRKLFAAGVDVDVVVREHRSGSGGTAEARDCIVASTAEVEDKK